LLGQLIVAACVAFLAKFYLNLEKGCLAQSFTLRSLLVRPVALTARAHWAAGLASSPLWRWSAIRAEAEQARSRADIEARRSACSRKAASHRAGLEQPAVAQVWTALRWQGLLGRAARLVGAAVHAPAIPRLVADPIERRGSGSVGSTRRRRATARPLLRCRLPPLQLVFRVELQLVFRVEKPPTQDRRGGE
jgi:hypothetical protein